MRTHFLYQFSIRIMIGSFLLASLVSGFAVAHFTAGSVAVDEAESSSRSIGEYRKDMKAFMKLSKNEDQQLQRNATYNLCELHAELVDDSRFDSSQQIQGFRATIAKRLENYSKEMKLKKKRADRAKKKQGLVANDQIAAGTRFTTRLPESQNNDSDDGHSADDMYSATSDSNDTMGQFTGGPNQFFGYAGGRFAPPWDHGEELLSLIENTINPSHWKRNGGNGSIQYYRPLRVLVVAASMQVQGETLDLLNALRRTGR